MATLITLPTTLPTHELGFAPAADAEHQVQAVAQAWLTQLEVASTTRDGQAFANLFVQETDGFWRDILAFTNDYRTIRGTEKIAQAASDRLAIVDAHTFTFTSFTPVLEAAFEDVSWITLHFDFVTKTGPAFGIARLVYSAGQWRAYMVFTLLEGIEGHPFKEGAARLRGTHNDKRSYDQRRSDEVEFTDSNPDVIIIGGGHNGLALAAQLKAIGLEALIVDQQKRTGDNWRLRYSSLSLHDPVYANHLPYYPFPKTWPVFTPAGKLANFLESYVDVLELNIWNESSTVPEGTGYDPATKQWNVTINRAGTIRKFTVPHVVLATGLGGGKPKMPAPYPGQESFTGNLVHSSGHGSGADWKGKKALVVGACTSAHDISTDFANNSVDITMLQRSPTFVMTVKNGMKAMVEGLYSETSPPTDLADRIGESNPKYLVKLMHQRIIPKLKLADKEVLDGLAKAGFQTTDGPDGSGFIMMALQKAGGYYFDTGASGLIASGAIKVQNGEIASFDGADVVFKDGSRKQYDTVVFATGYTGFPDTVKATIGAEYAEKFNPVWGLDSEGEIQGVARESGIPGLFFLVGNLSAARISSKVLALQIVAQQLGIFGERYTADRQARGVANGVNGH